MVPEKHSHKDIGLNKTKKRHWFNQKEIFCRRINHLDFIFVYLLYIKREAFLKLTLKVISKNCDVVTWLHKKLLFSKTLRCQAENVPHQNSEFNAFTLTFL